MSWAERTHGGLSERELRALGIAPESVLDLSANLNPYGPSPALLTALAAAPLHRYPDPESTRARIALAEAAGAAPEAIVLGNGATELLWTLTRVLAAPGERVLIAEPAFGELRVAARAHGCDVIAVTGRPERDHAVDFAALGAEVERSRPAFAYLCNPTAPLGAAVALAEIAAFAAERPELPIVLDESFLALSDHAPDAAVPLPAHVIRVRSLTKDCALPGVRVGYALVPPELAPLLERARPCWTVGAAAQAVAEAAARDGAFITQSRLQLRSDRTALVDGLRALEYAPFASAAPYVALPVGDAARLRERLLVRHRVLVRDCTSFGLPGVIRVAVRPQAERDRLLAALREERAAW